jgi:hypothetical protein
MTGRHRRVITWRAVGAYVGACVALIAAMLAHAVRAGT